MNGQKFSTRLALVSSILLTSGAMAQSLSCPNGTDAAAVAAWRDDVAQQLQNRTVDERTVAAKIRECFSAQTPKCVEQMNDFVTRNDTSYDQGDIRQVPAKRPPDELLAGDFQYQIPANIEQLARDKGWTAARYKSRHAGGFDGDTSSLLMVYVPGNLNSPPDNVDRWLNFAVPPDTGIYAYMPLAPIGEQPSAAPLDGNWDGYPSTFTMVSAEKATLREPAKVYFQMFGRNGSTYSPQGAESVSGCISCHPNGLRHISPQGYHVRAGEAELPTDVWKNVQKINGAMEKVAGGKIVSWRTGADGKPLLKPQGYGPIMGPIHDRNDPSKSKLLNGVSRSKEFIMGGTIGGQRFEGCYKTQNEFYIQDIFGRPPGSGVGPDGQEVNHYKLSSNAPRNINWETVADAMNCQRCHDNRARGALNELLDRSQLEFKVLVDQSMPSGYHTNPLDQEPRGQVIDKLTPDERIAIVNCLFAEFDLEQEHLAKWLSQPVCR